jgi:hypothetical protein
MSAETNTVTWRGIHDDRTSMILLGDTSGLSPRTRQAFERMCGEVLKVLLYGEMRHPGDGFLSEDCAQHLESTWRHVKELNEGPRYSYALDLESQLPSWACACACLALMVEREK